jgi:hypothetical protein
VSEGGAQGDSARLFQMTEGGGGQARHGTAAAGGEVMSCSVGQGWARAGNGRGLTSRPGQSGSGGPQ